MAPGDTLQRLTDVDEILKRTVAALESGRNQITDLANQARAEYQAAKRELERMKQQVTEYIRQVDELEKRDHQVRVRLMEVSRDFQRYGEADIRSAYEKAQDVQVALSVLREKESHLRRERDALERRLQSLELMAGRAEALAKQVDVAMQYLSGDLRAVTGSLRNLQERRDLGLSIIKAQEEERRRVAREIHDGPAQLLANVVLRIDICQRLAEQDPGRLRAELSELKELVRMSLQDVRKVIFDLRPMALDDLGLAPALRSYLGDFKEKTKIETELTMLGRERRLTPAFEVALFRLVQEALNNVAKHARANEVKVTVEFAANLISLRVRDNGRGFDTEQVRQAGRGSRFGLISMRERAELLQGQFQVESAPGRGTTVSFSIPAGDQGEGAQHA